MNHKEIIHSIQNEMKKFFTEEHTGHDWYHIERVWKNAKKLLYITLKLINYKLS